MKIENVQEGCNCPKGSDQREKVWTFETETSLNFDTESETVIFWVSVSSHNIETESKTKII